MAEQQIHAHRITKPIQLVAAWLVGLVLTNGMFLGAATWMSPDSWLRAALVLAAIANVPVFLVAIFVLQTRFRAELQEDSYYAEYLSKKTSEVVRIEKSGSAKDSRVEFLERQVALIASREPIDQHVRLATSGSNEIKENTQLDWMNWRVAINALHPQFDQIRAALRDAEIPISELFGTTTNSTVPSRWLISVSEYLPISHKVKLLRTLSAYDFDGFQLWIPEREAAENEDVYIGSYGGGLYATWTPDLEALLGKPIDDVDLQIYAQQFQAVAPNESPLAMLKPSK